MQSINAQGKLLITGEYFVLDGARALANPCRFGQSLWVDKAADGHLYWTSFDHHQNIWFEAHWQVGKGELLLLEHSDEAVAQRLQQIFEQAIQIKASAIEQLQGKKMTTNLSFPKDWGLGTSSTLLSLLSQYLELDAYALLEQTFGGSAYDIACATAKGPILYERVNGVPKVEDVDWYPEFREELFFVYQGQKQNSRAGIQRYRSLGASTAMLINDVNSLTMALLETTSPDEFKSIIEEHEKLVAATIQLPSVKAARFSSFPGAVKSLGAWGGDFVMVLSPWKKDRTQSFFNDQGCRDVLSFDEMLLNRRGN